MKAIDWSTYPEPWRQAGPRFRELAAEIAADSSNKPPLTYLCEYCDFATPFARALNGHRMRHLVWGK